MTWLGTILLGPIGFVLLILVLMVVINVVIIIRISESFDKAAADWINAETDNLVDKYKDRA